MRIVQERVSIRVPASALLFNSDFSSVAIGLDLWDEISAKLTTGASKAILLGQGSANLAKDATHQIIQVMLRTLEQLGQPAVGIELVCRNNIPRGIGLGDAEADVLAGILLVRALLGTPAEFDDLLVRDLAAKFAVQPARFAAAFAGGAQIAWSDKDGKMKTAALNLAQLHTLALIIPREMHRTNRINHNENRHSLPVLSPIKEAAAALETPISSLSIPDSQLRATVPASAAPLLLYALEHRPSVLRDVAFAARQAAIDGRTEKVAETQIQDAARLAQLLDALQAAGWPALGLAQSAAIIVFAPLQGAMQADLVAAGFSVISVQTA